MSIKKFFISVTWLFINLGNNFQKYFSDKPPKFRVELFSAILETQKRSFTIFNNLNDYLMENAQD